MALCGIGHVAFKCRNVEESLHYYHDILGCPIKFRLTYGEWARYVLDEAEKNGTAPNPYAQSVLSRGDDVWITYIELGNGQFAELFDPDGTTEAGLVDGKLNYQHVAIVTDDIHALYKSILEKGGPIDSAPSFGMEHTWQMWSHDPDGNKIEFMQYTDQSFQVVGRS